LESAETGETKVLSKTADLRKLRTRRFD